MPPGPRRRLPLPRSWTEPRGPRSPRRARVVAVGLGWLVLMTIWGFGRSMSPEHAPAFLVVGLVAGAVTAALGVRRARRDERRARAAAVSGGQPDPRPGMRQA